MSLNDKLRPYEGKSVSFGDMKLNCFFSKSALNNASTYDSLPHLHAGVEIHFISEGEISFITDDKFFTLKSNTVCIIPPRLSHLIEVAKRPCRSFAMMLNFEEKINEKQDDGLCDYYKKIYSSFDDILIIDNADKIVGLVNDFIKALKENKRDSDYMADALLKIIFLELTRSICSLINIDATHTANATQTKETEMSYTELESFIMHNYYKNLTIEDVAKSIGYSPAYTAKKIKKSFGMTYFDLIIKLKMSYAKREILETNRPFSEIAESVGYNSYNGFSLAFKKYYGKTPEQMRKEGKKANEL